MCVSHQNNRLPSVADISTTKVSEPAANCADNRMALGSSLLNLNIGSTSAGGALPPATPSWLRSVEDHQFLPQTPSPPNTSSNQQHDPNHSPSSASGDKVTLKPSKLGALGNGEPLLGNGAWKHSRLPTHPDRPLTHSDNVFRLMNGLTLKEPVGSQSRPLHQFCPQDHLNWRGRKKLQLPPNGFNSAPVKDARCIKEPDELKLHTMKRRIGNGALENSKSSSKGKNCRIYMLVLCLFLSLAFNGVLIALFFL